MNKLLPLLALSLTAAAGSCHVDSASATHTCSVAITASMTAQEIAQLFISRGIEPVRAQKAADAIHSFQVSVETGCALVGLVTKSAP